MTLATGVGSHPGDDQHAFDQAVQVVLDQVPDLVYLPEVPGRGASASMTGRALAVVAGLGADLQPAGWRLTDAAGVDQRRARSLLAQDLDGFEERTQGYDGVVKVQIAGPWTLAATVERPRGDKVLADHGARRDLAQGLAEGLSDHIADLRRRVPDAVRLVVQVDEPALAAVLNAQVPTASGFGRHRMIYPPEASQALEWVLGAIAAAGAEPWVHSCAPGTPLTLLRGAGAVGLAVDHSVASAKDHDDLAEALESGGTVALGLLPAVDSDTTSSETQLVESVERWLDMVGQDPDSVADRLVITPGCGLAGASPQWARLTLGLAQQTAIRLRS